MILAVLAAALLGMQEDAAERIRRAVDWFSDPDPQMSALGRRELIAIGPQAVPHLEKLLELRNALDIYRLMKDVEKAAGSWVPRWVGEGDLPDEEELRRNLPKVGGSEIDTYVRAKLKEAYAAARTHQYQRGYDIVHALLLLEPRSPFAEEIRKIRKVCDNMLTQTALLRSRVVAPDGGGVTPGTPEFLLRMENRFSKEIRVVYDRGTATLPATPLVVIEIACDRMDPNGSVIHITRTLELTVEHEIPIALGAAWEKAFTVDVGADFSDDRDCLRIYTVGAWTQPMKLEFGTVSAPKRILFEPATFLVVPEKHAHMLEDPLAALDKAMDAGTVNEVFVSAFLVPETRRAEAVDRLVGAMERSKSREGRSATAQILSSLTGQRHGVDPRRWRSYADGLKSGGR